MAKENKNIAKEKKILSPKIDVVFQALFGEVGSEKITKDLLESILEEKIDEVNLEQNPILRREALNDKMGIVDVIALLNGNEYCNIEMQLADRGEIIKRLLYYWSRLYARGIKKSEGYNELRRTIAVLIANFDIKGLEEFDILSRWKIMETSKGKKILTEDLEIDIIELTKLKNSGKNSNKELIKWLKFIENPTSKEVQEYMKTNDRIKEAGGRLAMMSEDEKMQRLADLREKAILEEKTIENMGYRKGKEERISRRRKAWRKTRKEAWRKM